MFINFRLELALTITVRIGVRNRVSTTFLRFCNGSQEGNISQQSTTVHGLMFFVSCE